MKDVSYRDGRRKTDLVPNTGYSTSPPLTYDNTNRSIICRFFYNERTTQDILPDAIPNNEEIPYGPAIVAQRPRSRAFELGYVKGINWTLGKYAVLHEGGDTIYHTRDELRVFNKTHVCGKDVETWLWIVHEKYIGTGLNFKFIKFRAH